MEKKALKVECSRQTCIAFPTQLYTVIYISLMNRMKGTILISSLHFHESFISQICWQIESWFLYMQVCIRQLQMANSDLSTSPSKPCLGHPRGSWNTVKEIYNSYTTPFPFIWIWDMTKYKYFDWSPFKKDLLIPLDSDH